jgi:hypothetical protein
MTEHDDDDAEVSAERTSGEAAARQLERMADVVRERQAHHGDARRQHALLADMMSAYIEGAASAPLTAADAMFMLLLTKISRISTAGLKREHVEDVAGYAGLIMGLMEQDGPDPEKVDHARLFALLNAEEIADRQDASIAEAIGDARAFSAVGDMRGVGRRTLLRNASMEGLHEQDRAARSLNARQGTVCAVTGLPLLNRRTVVIPGGSPILKRAHTALAACRKESEAEVRGRLGKSAAAAGEDIMQLFDVKAEAALAGLTGEGTPGDCDPMPEGP